MYYECQFSRALRMLFFKVTPGRETEVAVKLGNAIPHGHLFLVFGDYDLLLVTEVPEEHTQSTDGSAPFSMNDVDRLASGGSIPYILGAREVLCFAIETNDDAEAAERLERFLKVPSESGHVVAATFLRMPGFFSSTLGQHGKPQSFSEPTLESRFLKDYAGKRELDVQGVLLGTLGGPEFVVLRSESSMPKLYDWLARLHDHVHSFDKSFSVVGVRWAQSDSVEGSAVMRAADTLGDFGGGLRLDLRAACRRSDIQGVKRLLCDAFAQFELCRIAFMPGADDLVATVEPTAGVRLSHIIDAILTFRDVASSFLINTTSTFYRLPVDDDMPAAGSLSASASSDGIDSVSDEVQGGAAANGAVPDDEPAVSGRCAAPTRPMLFVNPDLAQAVLKSNAIPWPLGRVVLRALYSYHDLLQHPLLYDELIDMMRAFLEPEVESGTGYSRRSSGDPDPAENPRDDGAAGPPARRRRSADHRIARRRQFGGGQCATAHRRFASHSARGAGDSACDIPLDTRRPRRRAGNRTGVLARLRGHRRVPGNVQYVSRDLSTAAPDVGTQPLDDAGSRIGPLRDSAGWAAIRQGQ
jgi:hypothetical protein